MRADNNWEEKVGKKLFEFEGELSPQAWQNINQRIASRPKRWKRWFWLPALLLFIGLPLAFWLKNNDSQNGKTGEIALQQPGAANNSQVPSFENTLPETAAVTADQPAILPQKPVASNSQVGKKVLPKTQGATENPANSKANNGLKNEQLALVLPGEEKQPGNTENTRTPDKKYQTRNNLNPSGLVLNPPKVPVKTVGKTTEKPNASSSPVVASENNTSASSNQTTKSEISETGTGKALPNSKTGKAKNMLPSHLQPKAEQVLQKPAETAFTSEAAVAAANNLIETKPGVPAADSINASVTVANKVQASQDSITKKDKQLTSKNKNWSFGIFGAPQYTFQRVAANVNDEVLILRLNNKNALESERLGYDFGLRGFYPVTKNIQLELGVQVARINQYLNFTTASTFADTVIASQQNGQTTLEIRNREITEILLFKYYFAGLYAGGKMQLGERWFLTGGLGTNWMFMKNPDEETIPIRTQSFNPYLSAGLRYQLPISKNVALQVGPTMQYYLRPIQQETAFYKAKPTTFGFTVGFVFGAQP